MGGEATSWVVGGERSCVVVRAGVERLNRVGTE